MHESLFLGEIRSCKIEIRSRTCILIEQNHLAKKRKLSKTQSNGEKCKSYVRSLNCSGMRPTQSKREKDMKEKKTELTWNRYGARRPHRTWEICG